jgi:hypothetical protein
MLKLFTLDWLHDFPKIITLKVAESIELTRWVLSRDTYVKAFQPANLREEVISNSNTMLKQYDSKHLSHFVI